MFEDPIIRIIFFLILIPITWLSTRWIWKLICKTAGVTKEEILEYRKGRQGENNAGRSLSNWLLIKTDEPKKLRMLLNVYQICTIPSIICSGLAVFGLLTHTFDGILDWAIYVVLAIPIIIGFAGAVHLKLSK